MMRSLTTYSALLFEPRQLFYHAARYSIEAHGCPVNKLLTDRVLRDCDAFKNRDVLIAIGLCGAGHELYSLLTSIHLMTETTANLVVWLPEQDRMLADFLRALGVNSLLCETYLAEELPQRLDNVCFTTPHFPLRDRPVIKGGLKGKLSRTELAILLDCSRGRDAHEMAALHNINHKTVFAHIHNARIRLNLEDRNRWFDLLNRLKKISTVGSEE